MSSITEELADQLAQDTIAAAEELGDENLIAEVAKVIGIASTTTQEAFMTAIRVRLSERRARKFLQDRLASGPKGARIELGGKHVLNASEDGSSGH